MRLCHKGFLSEFLIRVILITAFSAFVAANSQETNGNLKSWSPITGMAPRDAFVASATCVSCHTNLGEAATQTPMSQATLIPGKFDLLHGPRELTFKLGRFRYNIQRKGEQFTYSVDDGKDRLSERIQYAFGYGTKGQTYVFLHDGAYYESYVSYYTGVLGLDVTFGYTYEVPNSLERALGRRLSPSETQLCFACHTTAAVTRGRLNVGGLMPGVGCEDCHGPGAEHVAAMKAGRFGSTSSIPDVWNRATFPIFVEAVTARGCKWSKSKLSAFVTSGSSLTASETADAGAMTTQESVAWHVTTHIPIFS